MGSIPTGNTLGKNYLWRFNQKVVYKRRTGEVGDRGSEKKVGDDLRSQEVTLQVPSALTGLTAGFEKRPGVSPPLQTPAFVSLALYHTPPVVGGSAHKCEDEALDAMFWRRSA